MKRPRLTDEDRLRIWLNSSFMSRIDERDFVALLKLIKDVRRDARRRARLPKRSEPR